MKNRLEKLKFEFSFFWLALCVFHSLFFIILIKFNYFASDWRQLIHVAAIDCAEERNLPTCVHYNIEGYPSVKVCVIY